MTKEQKIVKFNLIMSFTLLGIFLIMLVGITIAYFSDMKQNAYVLTSGNVNIMLSESAIKQDSTGNFVKDPDNMPIFGGKETTVRDYGKIFPAQFVDKDPTITNTGDNSAWIAAKVILTDGEGDLRKVMGYEGFDALDIEVLLSGGLLDEEIHFGDWNGFENVCHNDRYAMLQNPNAADGVYEFYFIMLSPLKVGDSVTLFDRLTVPAEWDNAEMQELCDLKIQVQAFGVQTQHLGSCFEAMTEAFPDHFNLN